MAQLNRNNSNWSFEERRKINENWEILETLSNTTASANNGLKAEVDEVKVRLSENTLRVTNSLQISNRAESKADASVSIANSALNTSNRASSKSDEAIRKSEEAASDSETALQVANDSKQTAELVRNQFNEVVAEAGSNNPEVVASRTDSLNNQSFSSLPDRLDGQYNNLRSEISETRTMISKIVVDVTDFGAKGDGFSDDGPSIRNAYQRLKENGGGTLFFPVTEGQYFINTTVEVDGFQVGLIHDTNGITFQGANSNIGIRAGVEMHSLIYAPSITYYTIFNKFYAHGNNLSNYAFVTATGIYSPYMTVNDSRFYNCKEFAFSVATYVSTFSKSIFANSKGGLLITNAPGNIATSTNVRSCYALRNTDIGFRTNLLVYSSFISCAVDNMPNGIAYDINGRGLTLTGCGCENVRQMFRSTSFRGLTINSFLGLNVGSQDTENRTRYLLELVTGVDATINGLHIQNPTTTYYDFKLGLTTANYGFENITILDDSIRRAEAFFVPNFKFERPIKFLRGDQTTKDETFAMTVQQLPAHLASIAHLEINHVYTITLSDGAQDINTAVNRISNLRGNGKLIIQGNADDRSLVKLVGAYQKLYLRNSNVSIEFRNLTIQNTTASGYSNIIDIDNCPNVTLNNVSLNANGFNTGAAIFARNGTKVNLIGNTVAEGNGSFGYLGVYKAFDNDATSTINLQPATAPPTLGAWQMGLRLKNSTPAPGGYESWVCVTTGRPGTWKGFGIIEA